MRSFCFGLKQKTYLILLRYVFFLVIHKFQCKIGCVIHAVGVIFHSYVRFEFRIVFTHKLITSHLVTHKPFFDHCLSYRCFLKQSPIGFLPYNKSTVILARKCFHTFHNVTVTLRTFSERFRRCKNKLYGILRFFIYF